MASLSFWLQWVWLAPIFEKLSNVTGNSPEYTTSVDSQGKMRPIACFPFPQNISE
jgi:hypothetical protein